MTAPHVFPAESRKRTRSVRMLGVVCGVAVSAAVVGFGLNAFASDLETLTRLLIPAYMAQNFTVLRTDRDARYLSGVHDETALLSAFAEHVKKEVTANLPEVEAERGPHRCGRHGAPRNAA